MNRISSTHEFRILDAMVLIIAIASAFAIVRSGIRNGDLEFAWLSHGAGSLASILQSTWSYIGLTLPFAVTLTASILGLEFLHRRSMRPSLVRCPGLIACLGATIALLLSLAGKLLGYGLYVQDSHRRSYEHFGMLLGISFWQESWEWASKTGMAVAVCWSILFFGQSWKAEPNWIDRVGRVLGVYWLIALSLSWFTNLSD